MTTTTNDTNNKMYDNMFNAITNRNKALDYKVDCLTMHAGLTNKTNYNISGNIKIEYNQASNEQLNYMSIINSRKEAICKALGTNFMSYILDLINSKNFVVEPMTNEDIKESTHKPINHITSITSKDTIAYSDFFDYDYYTQILGNNNETDESKTTHTLNPIQCWNLLVGRSGINKDAVNKILGHVVNCLNNTIEYVVSKNLTVPDEQFATLIAKMFTDEILYSSKPISKVYDYTHYTLLLPALVQYFMKHECCTSANDMIGYIAKGSCFYPLLENKAYNEQIKYLTDEEIKADKVFKTNEIHVNKYKQQLFTSYYYNNPFTTFSNHSMEPYSKKPEGTLPSDIVSSYTPNEMIDNTISNNFTLAKQCGSVSSPKENVTSLSLYLTEADIDDYFEFAGYMIRPYDYTALSDKNDPNTTRQLLVTNVSGDWSKEAKTEKDNCGHRHNRGLKNITAATIQSNKTGNLLIYNPNKINDDGRFRVPYYYRYKSSFWCTTWHDSKPNDDPNTFQRYMAYGNYTIDADPTAENESLDFNNAYATNKYYPLYKGSDTTYKSTDIKVKKYENNNILRKALNYVTNDYYTIPIYKIKNSFTKVVVDDQSTQQFSTGNWYQSDKSSYTNKYYLKYSDCVHNIFNLATGQVEKCYPSQKTNDKGESIPSDNLFNYFTHFTNIRILPKRGTSEATCQVATGHFQSKFNIELIKYTYKSTIPDDKTYQTIPDKEKYEGKIVTKSPKLDSTPIKSRNDAITLFKTVDHIYYFNDKTFVYWFYQVMTKKSLQKMLDDIRVTIGECPEIIMIQRIRAQMIPNIGIKNNLFSTASYIDLPLGPPLVRFNNVNGVFKYNKFNATIKYAPLKANENVKYINDDSSSVIAMYTNISSTYAAGNVLDDYMYQQLLMCTKTTMLNNNDCWIIRIPACGTAASNIMAEKSNLFGGKCFKRDIMQNDKLGYDDVSNQLVPHILISLTPINDLQNSVYDHITTLHVPIFSIQYDDKTSNTTIKYDALTDSSDNKVYIYVTKPSECTGASYFVNKVENDKVNKSGKNILYFTIEYDGKEVPAIPAFLKLRQFS